VSVLLWEVVFTGALLFAVAFVMHAILIKKGYKISGGTTKTIEHQPISKPTSLRTNTTNLASTKVMDKWFSLGGGYYGSMALVKLILIEFDQLTEFILSTKTVVTEQGFMPLLEFLTIGSLISFFVGQIMNFVAAVIWPVRYLALFDIWSFAIFVVLTYFIYEAARQLAQRHIST